MHTMPGPNTYLAVWEIRDPSMPFGDLLEEAEDALTAMATADAVELTGPARWELSRERLVAQAPARALPPAFAGPLPWESPQALLDFMMPDA